MTATSIPEGMNEKEYYETVSIARWNLKEAGGKHLT